MTYFPPGLLVARRNFHSIDIGNLKNLWSTKHLNSLRFLKFMNKSDLN